MAKKKGMSLDRAACLSSVPGVLLKTEASTHGCRGHKEMSKTASGDFSEAVATATHARKINHDAQAES